MRAICPSCGAEYEVPDRVAASGRSLRCARCAATWKPEAAAPAEVAHDPAPAPAAELPARMEAAPALQALLQNPAPVPAPRRPPWVVAGAWAASLLLLAACGWAAISGREAVMQAWPPSTRLYAALGYVTQ